MKFTDRYGDELIFEDAKRLLNGKEGFIVEAAEQFDCDGEPLQCWSFDRRELHRIHAHLSNLLGLGHDVRRGHRASQVPQAQTPTGEQV